MADYLACTPSGGGFKCFGCNSLQGGPFMSSTNLSGSNVSNYACDQWHGASVGQPGPSGTIPIIDKVPYDQKPIGVRPPIGVKPLRLKRRTGRFSGHSNMNHSNFSHSNFVSRGNDNAIWSGAQTNVGSQDRIYAGNYASGQRSNVQNNCIVARQEGGGGIDCSKYAPAGQWKPCFGDRWSCCRGPARAFNLGAPKGR